MQEAEVRNVKKFTQIKSSQKLEEFTSKLLYLTKLNVLLHVCEGYEAVMQSVQLHGIDPIVPSPNHIS